MGAIQKYRGGALMRDRLATLVQISDTGVRCESSLRELKGIYFMTVIFLMT
jgi:hypothetical protein